MRKIILLLSIIALSNSATAQLLATTGSKLLPQKQYWFDLQVAQHVGLRSWNDTPFINDGFQRAAITEFRAVANLVLADPHFGAFVDMGLGIMPASRMKTFDPERGPMPNMGTQYYLREIVKESGNGGSAAANFKMTFGLFGNISLSDKSSIMPYLGVGFMTMPSRSYEIVLKEEGSNIEYNAQYRWNADEYDNPATLGYLSARVNYCRRFSPKTNLIVGLEYTSFLKGMEFGGKFTNAFNPNLTRDFSSIGNKMNMIGVTVGLAFR